MKNFCVVAVCALLLLCPACSQKVNDPADVKAIKDLLTDYSKASSEKDAAFFGSTIYMDDAVRLQPNGVPIKGKDEIVKSTQKYYGNYTPTNTALPVDEVLTSGDLAVAKGTYAWVETPTASGLPVRNDPGKWVAVYKRQPDGSWKCAFDIWNSDKPATGATADGAEEAALYQLERDWAAADLKKDTSVVDKYLAKEFVANRDGKVFNKAQYLADMKSDPAKVESAENGDMVAMVFGDTAVVHGLYIQKSTTNGKDSSMKGRYTEVYVKRDGRWQCMTQYATKVQ